MNFDVEQRTIFLARHGSHAYGLNRPDSDEDFKGICIKPKSAYLGFVNQFEQFEHMGSKSDGVDKVVYSLEKFAALAAACNPNIIEVLHVDDSDVIVCDEFGEALRAHRYDFLSKKAKHTFTGYMYAQIKRMKTHRGWLMDDTCKTPPNRADFGLSTSKFVTKSELGAYDNLIATHEDIILPENVVTLFTREKAYYAAKVHHDQYMNWVKTRNPKRAELEAKFGYDTKHAYHVIRLGRMSVEILQQQKVIVKRHEDREELMSIRDGAWSYDRLLDEAEKLNQQAEEAYTTSTLRHEPDRNALDNLIVDLTSRYLSKYG